MGKPPDARLTPEIAREVCQRTNSAAVLQGSIAQIGTQYSIFLKAVSCATGESLASTEAQAGDKSQVLEALNKAASSMREKLGESLTTVQAFDTPVEQATTPSLEALHAYSVGVKTKDVTGDEAAVPLFEEAIRLDPNFAMAYALLGTSYSNLGERKRGAELLEKAYGLREHVSEPEKFYIDAYYHDLVLGDLPKSMQLYESWTQAYPRDVRPVGNLGLLYGYIGQHEKAVDQAREALQSATRKRPEIRQSRPGLCSCGKLGQSPSHRGGGTDEECRFTVSVPLFIPACFPAERPCNHDRRSTPGCRQARSGRHSAGS